MSSRETKSLLVWLVLLMGLTLVWAAALSSAEAEDEPVQLQLGEVCTETVPKFRHVIVFYGPEPYPYPPTGECHAASGSALASNVGRHFPYSVELSRTATWLIPAGSYAIAFMIVEQPRPNTLREVLNGPQVFFAEDTEVMPPLKLDF